MRKLQYFTVTIAVLSLILSCSLFNSVTTPAPIPNAGTDQTVVVGTLVALNASTSAGTNLSFSWSLASGPASIQIGNSNQIVATFTPPVPGTYIFTLTVTNAGGTKQTTVTVTATAPISLVPEVPTGLASSAGDTIVTLTWTVQAGAAGYNVYRSTTSGTPGLKLNPNALTGSSYADSAVQNGTTYYYSVTATNTAGESGATNQISATPQMSIAGAPTGLSAAAGNAQVVVSWTLASGATGYNVYRSNSSGTQGSKLNLIAITGSSYTDSTAVNGTTYYYNVTALNAAGESGLSSQTSATPQVPVAGAPVGLSASAGNAQVGLTWTSTTGATGYNVYRSTSSGTQGGRLNAAVLTGTTYTDRTALNETTYYYSVSATNAGGESGASNQASARPQVPAPTTPTGLSAVANDGAVTLSWSGSNGASQYNVYRSTSSGISGTNIASPKGSSYTDADVANGTAYFYEVTAQNDGGESGLSNQASATPQISAPNAPTNLSATAGDSTVSLSWATVLTADRYNLYRSTSSGAQGTKLNSSSITLPSYTDSTAVNGIRYYFAVTAVNAGGESGLSGQADAMPQVPLPNAPHDLSATPGNSQVVLSWTAMTGIAGYNVYRSTASGTLGTKLNPSLLASAGYTDTTALAGTTYYYCVTANNQAGESSPSQAVQAAATAGTAAPVPSSYEYIFVPQSGPSSILAPAAGLFETTAEGLKFSGNQYRTSSTLKPKTFSDLRNGTVYVKWRPNGANQYTTFGVHIYRNNGADISSGCWGTTHNSYNGSVVLSDNAWYFTRIAFGSTDYSSFTATGDYDNSGGTVVTTLGQSGSALGASLSQAAIGFNFNDNYGGTLANMTISDLRAELPAPTATWNYSSDFEGGAIAAPMETYYIAPTLVNSPVHGGSNSVFLNGLSGQGEGLLIPLPAQTGRSKIEFEFYMNMTSLANAMASLVIGISETKPEAGLTASSRDIRLWSTTSSYYMGSLGSPMTTVAHSSPLSTWVAQKVIITLGRLEWLEDGIQRCVDTAYPLALDSIRYLWMHCGGVSGYTVYVYIDDVKVAVTY